MKVLRRRVLAYNYVSLSVLRFFLKAYLLKRDTIRHTLTPTLELRTWRGCTRTHAFERLECERDQGARARTLYCNCTPPCRQQRTWREGTCTQLLQRRRLGSNNGARCWASLTLKVLVSVSSLMRKKLSGEASRRMRDSWSSYTVCTAISSFQWNSVALSS